MIDHPKDPRTRDFLARTLGRRTSTRAASSTSPTRTSTSTPTRATPTAERPTERPVPSASDRHGVAAYHRAMAQLTRADVEHVAHLARLGLTDEELARLEGQLNHILDQYAKLAELDTDAIPPTAQVIELENILREDVARPVAGRRRPCWPTRPQRDGDFFVVPAILGGD